MWLWLYDGSWARGKGVCIWYMYDVSPEKGARESMSMGVCGVVWVVCVCVCVCVCGGGGGGGYMYDVSPVRPSSHHALITTLQPTILNRSYSYLAQQLTLIWAWTYWLWRFYFHFPSSGTLKLYEYIDRLVSWSRPDVGSRPVDGIF